MHTSLVLCTQRINCICSASAPFRRPALTFLTQPAHPLTRHSSFSVAQKHRRGHRCSCRRPLFPCKGLPEDKDDAQHEERKTVQHAEQSQKEDSEDDSSDTSTSKKWRQENLKKLQLGSDPPPKRTLQEEVYNFTARLVRNVAFPGTIAVTAAWFLKLDAFGNFHWDYGDVAQALLTISPFCFLLISVMLGDWESQLPESSPFSGFLTRSIQGEEAMVVAMPPSRGGAEKSKSGAAAPDAQEAARAPASGSSVAPLQQPEASSSGRSSSPAAESQRQTKHQSWPPQWTAQQTIYGALHAYQKTLVLGPSPPLTAANILLQLATRFTDEMAVRAVLLTALAGWCSDRLFEAGLGPTVDFLGQDLGTAEAGNILAVAIFCGYVFGLSLNTLRQSAKLEQLGRQMMEGKVEPEAAEAEEAANERAARLQALLPKPDAEKAATAAEAAKRQREEQQGAEARWRRHQGEMGRALRMQASNQASALLVGTVLSLGKLSTLCYLYLSTGNMAASFAASTAVSGIGIACREVRRGQLLQAQRDRLEELVSSAKAGALARLKEQRRGDTRAAAAASSASGSHDSEELSVDDPGEERDGSEREDDR